MRSTIGYHWVKPCYGLWLPGDERGHWSEAWDENLDLVEPGTLHAGDPVRERMARERMKHPPVHMTPEMINAVVDELGACVAESNGGLSIIAAVVELTHLHALIPYSDRDIHRTVKWLADRTTKAIHRTTNHASPVWCSGRWCQFIFDEDHWQRLIAYIERHHIRAGRPARPYPFLTP